ncbi:MAG: hypothetical protein MK108_10845 [Mariniblastus sp.]|nr:hypothetical protein [Mariniblastus sp.]
MNGSRHNSVPNRCYRKVFRRRRFRALLVTGLAVFLSCCVICAFGAKGISTTTELTLQTSEDGDLTDQLRKMVRDNLDDTSIKSAMAVVAQQTLPHPGDFSLLDRNSIRGGILFQVEKDPANPVYRITLSLTGEGSEEESRLLWHLATNISQQVFQVSGSTDHVSEIDKQANLLNRGFDIQESMYQGQWLQMETSLEGLDHDLQALYRQLKSRGHSARLAETAPAEIVAELQSVLQRVMETKFGPGPVLPTETVSGPDLLADQLTTLQARLQVLSERCNEAKRSPFSTVSHGGQGDAQIMESLEVVDPGQWNQELGKIRNALQDNLAVQRGTAEHLVSLAKRGIAGSKLIQQDIRTTRLPVGGMPSRELLILFGLASLLAGVVVSRTYQPELTDRGFRSCQHVSELLGLPVVAEFQVVAGDFRPDRQSTPFAISNRFVTCAEVALGSFILLTVTTCLLVPGIAETFAENPFTGLARLTWMLFPN